MQPLYKYQIVFILVMGWAMSSIISQYFESKRITIVKTRVLGDAVVHTKSSKLANSNELPILRVKSTRDSNAHSEIDESLFTVAKVERKRQVQEPKKPILDVNYFNEAKASIVHQININATLNNGAIVNGRFYSLGEFIDVSYSSPDGKVYKAKLRGVVDDGIRVDINNNSVVINYDF